MNRRELLAGLGGGGAALLAGCSGLLPTLKTEATSDEYRITMDVSGASTATGLRYITESGDLKIAHPERDRWVQVSIEVANFGKDPIDVSAYHDVQLDVSGELYQPIASFPFDWSQSRLRDRNQYFTTAGDDWAATGSSDALYPGTTMYYPTFDVPESGSEWIVWSIGNETYRMLVA